MMARSSLSVTTTPAPSCPPWCTEPHPADGVIPDCYGAPINATLPGAARPFLTARLWRCSITGRSSVEVYTADGDDACADLTPQAAAEFAATMRAFHLGLARLATQLRTWQHTEATR